MKPQHFVSLSNETKPILIVGASGSIGSAVAYNLGIAGYPVGLHYCTNQVAVQSLATELQKCDSSSILLQSNLSSQEDCKNLIHSFSSVVGKLYGLALCSGRVPWKHWEQTQDSDWYQAYFEHCMIPFFLAHAVSQNCLSKSRIIYLSSISPKYGGSELTLHYAAAKSALETTMKGLSKRLISFGVRINGVRAGVVETPQQQKGRTKSEFAERVRRIPLGRAGKPYEIASAFTYLFSEEADFINDEIITVAGGD